jgi:hypothetical protein
VVYLISSIQDILVRATDVSLAADIRVCRHGERQNIYSDSVKMSLELRYIPVGGRYEKRTKKEI